MRFAYVTQSRKTRAWVALIAIALVVILIAAVFLLSGRSPKPFEMDDLYGLLD
jgi:hypothetical protein